MKNMKTLHCIPYYNTLMPAIICIYSVFLHWLHEKKKSWKLTYKSNRKPSLMIYMHERMRKVDIRMLLYVTVIGIKPPTSISKAYRLINTGYMRLCFLFRSPSTSSSNACSYTYAPWFCVHKHSLYTFVSRVLVSITTF